MPYFSQQPQPPRTRRKRSLAATAVFTTVLVLGFDSTSAFSAQAASFVQQQTSRYRIQQSQHVTLVALSAKARRSASGGGSPPKGKQKNKTQNKKGNAIPKKTSPKPSSPSITAASAGTGPRAPPWQVLSQKDAKKNVEREKKRRDAIQSGQVASSDTLLEDDFDSMPLKVSKTFLSQADRALLSWKRFNPSTVGMKYVASVTGFKPLPRLGAPEIAFLGRSNVGKSSLLNRLSSYSKKDGGFNDQARVGKTPGATASVNLFGFYDKNEKPVMGFVDLPGFGYAKLSKGTKESVQEAAEQYLGKREELVLGILLVDSRRTPSEDDRIVLAALFDMGLPILVVATKVDKLNKNEVDGQLEQIRLGLGLPEGQPFSISSVTGEGTKALWNLIMEASENGIEEIGMKLQRGGGNDESDSEQLLDDDDDDERMYNQGYDWIQAGDVVYEEEEDDDDIWDGKEEDYVEDNYVEDGSIEENIPVQKAESLRDLRRRAKKMGY